jgi:hypothetical protein
MDEFAVPVVTGSLWAQLAVFLLRGVLARWCWVVVVGMFRILGAHTTILRSLTDHTEDDLWASRVCARDATPGILLFNLLPRSDTTLR